MKPNIVILNNKYNHILTKTFSRILLYTNMFYPKTSLNLKLYFPVCA